MQLTAEARRKESSRHFWAFLSSFNLMMFGHFKTAINENKHYEMLKILQRQNRLASPEKETRKSHKIVLFILCWHDSIPKAHIEL